MSRKPVHLTMTAGKPSGRQAIWEALRKMDRFTINDLWHTTKIPKATIQSYVQSLALGGFIGQVGMKKARSGVLAQRSSTTFDSIVYRMVNDIGIEAPRLQKDGKPCVQGQRREQMWRTMKMLPDFNYRDLAVMATTEEVIVADLDARDYVKHLAKANYLALVEKATHLSLARYRLLPTRNTGPRPPMIQRLKTVFDVNLCKIMWQEGGGE